MWETLVRDDDPEPYGIARKRIDCRTRKSPFNSRRQIRAAFERVVAAVRARYLLVSFNDEGYLSRPDLETILGSRGHVGTYAISHPRYVGARIGIHNRRGERVGRVGRLRNREYLYVVVPDARLLDAVAASLAAFEVTPRATS
jgi:adenine-specific DNA-methyltransferase